MPYASTMALYRDLPMAHYQYLDYRARISEKQAAVSFLLVVVD